MEMAMDLQNSVEHDFQQQVSSTNKRSTQSIISIDAF